jgi:hypothetical protein
VLRFILKKLRRPYVWKRIFVERLTEPLHLNLIACFVAVFGSFRQKVAFDLVVRHNHGYALLAQADYARRLGIRTLSVLEFGVAAGAGLLNLCDVARRVTRATGVEFKVYGFDTGKGMPPPQSYRDHPDLYSPGDFPMDQRALLARLPGNARLILGELAETVPQFIERLPESEPLAFADIDVDYYSSTRDALAVFAAAPQKYLPRVLIYLDDLEDPSHNSWCGERYAVHEFNARHERRKIEQHAFLKSYRIFRNARWIDHMFTVHVLDSAVRSTLQSGQSARPVVLENPYLG